MTNTYEKLRAKRNEMYPPVLEFGCEMKDTTGIGVFIKKETDEDRNIMLYKNKYKESVQGIEELNGMKILGKPLTTNDILLMLNKNSMAIAGNGDILECSGYEYKNILISIDLTKSIENQTEETLSAILGLVE